MHLRLPFSSIARRLRWRGRLVAALLAVALLAALAVAVGSALACHPAPRAQRWNVVVLMVDTLRADRLDLYGYRRATAPHLTELARSSVVFRAAHAQAGCTYPSVNSILTSRWPQHFLRRQDTYGMAIPDDTPALAELLARQGYATAAVSSSWIVRATPTVINHQGGFGRGFETFDEGCLARSAACVNQRAMELLGRLHEPFLLYLHYTDPHQPYHPPAWHTRRFALDPAKKAWVRLGDPVHIFRKLYDHDDTVSFDDDDVRHLSDLYDEEIAFFDDRLEELLVRLEEGGLLDRTIVVLLADHGEELYDHGHFGHCRDLAYETLLATPLVLRLPGGEYHGTSAAMADNLDLVPTLLDYLAIPHDAAGLAGKSLRPLIERGRPLHEYEFAAQGTSRVVSDGRYKLWIDIGDVAPRLFDLRDGEQTRATVAPTVLARLRAALRGWLDREEGSASENLRRARELEAKLKALGYL